MNTKFFISANLLFASHYLFSGVDSCLHHLPLQTMKKEKLNTFLSSRHNGQRDPFCQSYGVGVFSSGFFSPEKGQLRKDMKEFDKTI